jgi:hypothetical protein
MCDLFEGVLGFFGAGGVQRVHSDFDGEEGSLSDCYEASKLSEAD